MERIWRIITESFPLLLEFGIKFTIPITIASFAVAFLLSVFVALAQYAKTPVLRQLCRVYIWVIRGTPLLVQLFLVYYGLPKLGIITEKYSTAILVLGINEGAYMAESLRGALEAVPRGQLEAGLCVSMTYPKIMWHVVLPQAFRTVFPAFSNSFIAMLKETSLIKSITIIEMFRQAEIIAAREYEPLVLYTEVALIYLAFCSVLTLLQRRLEKRLDHYGGGVK
ncbi:MAG: amino acid ABC transporter permease [Clostridia bacterium]|nr:amino acid ABC transporter permease [Clostridia bacterium]